MLVRQKLGAIYRGFKNLYYRLSLSAIRFLISFFNVGGRLRLGYTSKFHQDGLGAQLQRVLAIQGLANFWKLQVLHQKVESISVHPLDQISTSLEIQNLNAEFNFLISATVELDATNEIIYVDELKVRNLINSIIRLQNNKSMSLLILLTHPYKFVDSMPTLYLNSIDQEFKRRLGSFINEDLTNSIAIHYRAGTGNYALQPNQRISRQIRIENFTAPLIQLLERTKFEKIVVYTDAPETPIIFYPPSSQRNSWQGLPGFDGESFDINAIDFQDWIRSIPVEVSIKRGGNPIRSLANLSQAQGLVLSNSSFGYCAALLGLCQFVYLPKSFWHPKLPKWNYF